MRCCFGIAIVVTPLLFLLLFLLLCSFDNFVLLFRWSNLYGIHYPFGFHIVVTVRPLGLLLGRWRSGRYRRDFLGICICICIVAVAATPRRSNGIPIPPPSQALPIATVDVRGSRERSHRRPCCHQVITVIYYYCHRYRCHCCCWRRRNNRIPAGEGSGDEISRRIAQQSDGRVRQGGSGCAHSGCCCFCWRCFCCYRWWFRKSPLSPAGEGRYRAHLRRPHC
mmetsp:Transcript_31557/g.69320  ORF Transcript_31557/g.69320 Transcript_31557/m.69320 type:complete len:223 (+) Transcript_31557:1971-2639(+)